MDYPRNQIEFEEAFSTEEKCLEAVSAIKWPRGFICPRCGGTDARTKSRHRVVCRTCQHETSPLVGTVFTGAHKPLRTWIHALWWITGQKNGISASGFKNIMGLGSYETAWSWLHKLRHFMGQARRRPLSRTVEVDECFVGGERHGKGRSAGGKVLVVLAVEVRGAAIGRIRMAVIPNAGAQYLEAFAAVFIRPGAHVITDGWVGYKHLGHLGFNHEVQFSKSDALPRVHRVISLMKRWLLGTHQGRISDKHIQAYLNEFVFRFNRRNSKSRGRLFGTLLHLCVLQKGLTYQNIITKTMPKPTGVPATQI
jgi:transposase-like protein